MVAMLAQVVVLVMVNTQAGASLSEHLPRGVSLLVEGERAAPEAIRSELGLMRASTPSLALGATLTAVGSAGVLAGVIAVPLGFAAAFAGGGSTLLIAALITLGLSVPIVIVGIVLAVRVTLERNRLAGDIETLERRLKAVEGSGPAATVTLAVF
jgi:ABC-type sulfate transport system permease component